MKKLLALSLLVLPAALVAAPAVNWVSRVTISAMGGHAMGRSAEEVGAAQPARLWHEIGVEHGDQFVGEASAPLKTNYVKGGKVSVEVRNAVRDKYDLTAALLARCGGPARFMGNHEALFANQDAWMERIQAYDSTATKPTEQIASLRDIGQKTGLYTLMGKRGFKPAQLDACVASPMAMKQILAMTDEAWNKVKIGGTPGFTVNGTRVEGSTWTIVQAALPPAPR